MSRESTIETPAGGMSAIGDGVSPRFDLDSAEARSIFADRVRAHKKEEKDQEIESLVSDLRGLVAEEWRSRVDALDRIDTWQNEKVRSLYRRLRIASGKARCQSAWAEYEARYKEVLRETRKAEDFESCREISYRVRHQVPGCEKKIHQPFSCDIRGCSRCGSRRVARLVDLYTDRVESLLSTDPWRSKFGVYALTLTTKHRRRNSTLPEWSEMQSVLRAGSHVGHRHFSKDNRGWLFAMELGSKGFMVHLHWIVIAPLRKPYKRWPIQISELNDSWAVACNRFRFPGDGGFGFIEPVARRGVELRENVAHLCKYISKPMSFDPERFADLFLRVPSNARWIRSGGVLHSGKKPTANQVRVALAMRETEGYPAPDVVEDIEFVERAERWFRLRPALAMARRAEIEKCFARDNREPLRCPDCGGLLYIDFSGEPLSRWERESGYIELRECRPPPLVSF